MIFLVLLLATFMSSIAAHSPPELEKLWNVELKNIENISKFQSLAKNDHPHAHMNVIELGDYYNYGTEAYTILTDDGYILEMHRFTGNRTNPNPKGKQPVFLMHGLSGSSMDWVVTGPKRGLAFILADLGYDVWMGNVRGNKYSRRHNKTSISDSEYWDTSFHDIGMHDLPVMINHVLKKSEFKKMFYIGHSQGCTSFFALLSELPEYNDKIIAMIALAPVAYLQHMSSPVFRTLAYLTPVIDVVFRLFGKYEFCPSGEFFQKFSSLICDESQMTQPICSNILFMVAGYNEELLDKELLPAILAHVPAGSSTKQYVHLTQFVRSDYFRQFDYGWMKNLKKYKSFSPPSYKLENIKIPVSVHYGANDWLVHPKDAEKLYSQLPNTIGKFLVPHEKFNHLDFVWALNVTSLLYDNVISILQQQEKLNAKNHGF